MTMRCPAARRVGLLITVGLLAIGTADVIGSWSASAAAPTCPADPTARPVLALGTRDRAGSNCVERLERFLDTWYPYADVRVDGKFTRTTKEAVRLFQTHSRFVVRPSGVVDAQTWSDIDAFAEPEVHPFSTRYPNLLMLGASNTVQARSLGLVEVLQLHGVAGTRDDVDAKGGTATTKGERSATSRLRSRVAHGDRPDVVLMFSGINDLGWAKWVDTRIPKIKDKDLRKAAYIDVYRAMIVEFMTTVDEELGPVPVVWATVAKRESKNLLATYFNEALLQVQSQRALLQDGSMATLTVADFATRMQRHQDEFRSDGTHLTEAGAVARLECIQAVVDAYESYGNTTVIPCPDHDHETGPTVRTGPS